ncbi:MAG: restriction endonuclease subunit S [Marinilabiliaceae bacterium]|nr:restriction endonuclease subunit S [Marinilabiliaceae bacterium]
MSTVNNKIINNSIEKSQPQLTKKRPGFKITKLGWWIPEEWDTVKIKDAAVVQTGLQKGAIKEGKKVSLPYLRVANVQDGHLNLSEIKYIEVLEDKVERYLLKKGDVLMTEGGDFDKLGRGTIWNDEIDNCLHQNHVFAVRTDSNILLPYFLNIFSSSEYGKHYFKLCSKQSTNLASINSTQLKNFVVPIPTITEQTTIITCLATWDKAIQTLTKLIAQKELRKKGLMQQLLTGKKRLLGFSGEWRLITFKDIYQSKKQKAGNEKFLVLSVTKDGIVSQAEYFKKEIASADTSPYLIVEKGDMVMSGLNFWMGSIDVLEKFDVGIVSPAYKVFEIKKADIDHLFMRYYVRSEEFLKALVGASVQGASVVRRNLDKEALEEWAFKLPQYDEQKLIAKVLQTADTEIELLKTKLDKLKEQKKGLMQQLLTGKKRLIQ